MALNLDRVEVCASFALDVLTHPLLRLLSQSFAACRWLGNPQICDKDLLILDDSSI